MSYLYNGEKKGSPANSNESWHKSLVVVQEMLTRKKERFATWFEDTCNWLGKKFPEKNATKLEDYDILDPFLWRHGRKLSGPAKILPFRPRE